MEQLGRGRTRCRSGGGRRKAACAAMSKLWQSTSCRIRICMLHLQRRQQSTGVRVLPVLLLLTVPQFRILVQKPSVKLVQNYQLKEAFTKSLWNDRTVDILCSAPDYGVSHNSESIYIYGGRWYYGMFSPISYCHLCCCKLVNYLVNENTSTPGKILCYLCN